MKLCQFGDGETRRECRRTPRVAATVHYAHEDELRGLEDFKGGKRGEEESGLDLSLL